MKLGEKNHMKGYKRNVFSLTTPLRDGTGEVEIHGVKIWKRHEEKSEAKIDVVCGIIVNEICGRI